MLVLKEFANFINSNLANLATTFAQCLGKSSLEYEAISVNSRTLTGRRLLKAVAEACELQTSEPLSGLFRSDPGDQLNSRWAAEIIPAHPFLEIECLGRTLTPVLTSLEAGRFVWDILSESRTAIIMMHREQAAGQSFLSAETGLETRASARHLEQELQTYRDRLADLVEARTVELQQQLSDLKQREQELLKFKLGIERLDNAVFLTDLEGTIIYVNPAFKAIYGYSRAEAVGQTPRILKSGLIPPEAYEKFWQKLLQGEVIAGEITNQAKDGRRIAIEATNIPLQADGGTITGFLGIHRDLTQRKRVEAEREQLLAEVERRAHREQIIREITEELRTAPNLEYLTKIAAEGLGRRLGATHAKLALGIENINLTPTNNKEL
jgi:PAS domain S-box-containing protein